jgi:hypothetical protein
MNIKEKKLHSLMPLENFKAVLGIDDREDQLARFCLVTSSLSIEQYCKRRLLHKRCFENIQFYGDLVIPLREYPVSRFLAAYTVIQTGEYGEWNWIDPDLYRVNPDCGLDMDIPYSIKFAPPVYKYRGVTAFILMYLAGYPAYEVPADLSAACLELASWNLNRYRGQRVGMTGNIKGVGIQGEHFEMSMPENVKALLEPYRRKTI